MKLLCITLLLMMSSLIHANEFIIDMRAFLTVYDGDGLRLKMRLANIDTPEIKGGCEKEKILAIKARNFTQKFIQQHPRLNIKLVGTGYYGRPLVIVSAGAKNLNKMLIEAGLARVYKAGHKIDWCH